MCSLRVYTASCRKTAQGLNKFLAMLSIHNMPAQTEQDSGPILQFFPPLSGADQNGVKSIPSAALP